MFSAKSKTSTGIHIVDSTVYIAELQRMGQAVAATRLVQADLPGVFTPGHLARDEVRWELAAVFERLGTNHDIEFTHANVALDRQAFQLKCLPVVPGKAEAQREHLLWEAEQFLADDLEAHAIDCQVFRNTGLVATARRPLLELYRDLFTQAEIEDIGFDLVPIALYNLARYTDILNDEDTVVVLDVAQFEACVVLVRGGAPVAVSMRSWNFGRDEQLVNLESCIKGLLEGTQELPQHLWISGTAAAESTWSYELPNRLGLVGELVDPFRGIDVAPLEQVDSTLLQSSPEYGVAVGLALGGLVDNGTIIHLDLLQERRASSSNIFARIAVFAVLAIVCIGVLYGADQRYPLYGVWKNLLAGQETAMLEMGEEEMLLEGQSAEGGAALGAAVEEEIETVEEMAAVEEAAMPQDRGAENGSSVEAAAEVVPVVGAVHQDEPSEPPVTEITRQEIEEEKPVAETARQEQRMERSPSVQWSGACLRILQLVKQLPKGVHFGSLIGDDSGEYTIEGARPTSVDVLTQLRDALKESSDDVNLSQWWAGRGAFKFSFKGQLKDIQTRRLRAVPASEATRLAARLEAWARESGLDSLEMEEPIHISLSETWVRQRQKLRAKGSYMEILSFATVLEQAGQTIAVSELIVMPRYLQEERWKQASFYMVVEMLMQAP